MCLCGRVFWGERTRIKKRGSEGNTTGGKRRHLFFLSFFEREQKRERRERVFSSFFWLRFFFDDSALVVLSLSFLSFSCFLPRTLVSLSARNSLHTSKLFGGGSKRQSSSSQSFLIIYKVKTTHAFRVLRVNARNKNRTHKAESERELLFDRRDDFFLFFNGDDEIFSRAFSLACCRKCDPGRRRAKRRILRCEDY